MEQGLKEMRGCENVRRGYTAGRLRLALYEAGAVRGRITEDTRRFHKEKWREFTQGPMLELEGVSITMKEGVKSSAGSELETKRERKEGWK